MKWKISHIPRKIHFDFSLEMFFLKIVVGYTWQSLICGCFIFLMPCDKVITNMQKKFKNLKTENISAGFRSFVLFQAEFWWTICWKITKTCGSIFCFAIFDLFLHICDHNITSKKKMRHLILRLGPVNPTATFIRLLSKTCVPQVNFGPKYQKF